MADHRPSSYGLQAPWLNRGPTTAALTGQYFLNPLPHVRPHAVMKLSLRTAFLQAKSALAFDAWYFYYTESTSKTSLHQMALSAWKANALQSISNSAIQSSVKGMQKRRERKKGQKRRGIFVKAVEASTPPASTSPSFLYFKSNYFFPLFYNILGGFSERLHVEVSY